MCADWKKNNNKNTKTEEKQREKYEMRKKAIKHVTIKVYIS